MQQPHLTVEQRRLALRLKARGWTLREIGPQVDCVFQTVARIAQRGSRRPVRLDGWVPGPGRLTLADREEITVGLHSGESPPPSETRSPPAGQSPATASPWPSAAAPAAAAPPSDAAASQPPQLIENLLDSPRCCADRLKLPASRATNNRQVLDAD